MPFNAWKHTERNRQKDRKKYVIISGGFVIPAVQNNSLNGSTQHSLEPTQILFKRPQIESIVGDYIFIRIYKQQKPVHFEINIFSFLLISCTVFKKIFHFKQALLHLGLTTLQRVKKWKIRIIKTQNTKFARFFSRESTKAHKYQICLNLLHNPKVCL